MSASYIQLTDKFYEAAASGDIENVVRGIKVGDPNKRNEKGWTALMFAARNGHANVVKAIMDNGGDQTLINSTGHTALDIAKFWNHKNVIKILEPDEEDPEDQSFTQGKFPSVTNHFAGSPLDRMAHKRKDAEWIKKIFEHKKTKLLLFMDLNTVTVPKPDLSITNKLEQHRLFTANWEELGPLCEEKPHRIFLGCEEVTLPGRDTAQTTGWFAVDISGVAIEEIQKLHPHAEVVDAFPGMMHLSEKEAAIGGQARSMLAWHDRYKFCPTCGAETTSEESGWKRTCTKEDCRSRKGIHNTSYPRTDPTAIMAVVSPDGKQVLLGRGKRFPRNMWSCLAGFMEPGESIEETCRREVFEEAGIRVGHVDYHSTQPWPMPASLMVGCIAYATTTDIVVDNDELQEARWFSRQDAIQMLTHQHPKGLFCPPQQAIAHQLILAWVNMTSNL